MRITVRAFFANAARQEGARSIAFRNLAEDLRELGAPRALLRGCLGAAERGRALTAQLAALAGTHAIATPHPPVLPRRVRSTFDVARDNARLGLVRATYATLALRTQASRAREEHVRTALLLVSSEKMEHVDLAFHVDRYLRTLLSARELHELDEAFGAEISDLARELEEEPPPMLVHACGVPDARLARELLQRLRARIWAQTLERLAA